jgi:hypothetical protein
MSTEKPAPEWDPEGEGPMPEADEVLYRKLVLSLGAALDFCREALKAHGGCARPHCLLCKDARHLELNADFNYSMLLNVTLALWKPGTAARSAATTRSARNLRCPLILLRFSALFTQRAARLLSFAFGARH